MADIILKTAITFFAVYGFVQVIKDIISMFLYDDKDSNEFFIVVKVKNSADTLESIIRLIIWKWLCQMRGRSVPNILIVDLGSTDETPQIANKLCDDFEFIYYTTEELYNKAKSQDTEVNK